MLAPPQTTLIPTSPASGASPSHPTMTLVLFPASHEVPTPPKQGPLGLWRDLERSQSLIVLDVPQSRGLEGDWGTLGMSQVGAGVLSGVQGATQ